MPSATCLLVRNNMSISKAAGSVGAQSWKLSTFDMSEPWATRVFHCFVLLHLIVWTALPAFLTHTLPQDVLEGLAWGQEWQLGYFKHPPLQAWLLEAVAWLSGHRAWACYLLS